MADRLAVLVLAGGGARGAFQVGAERVLREEGSFRWTRVLGVSVGALNATLIAQGEYDRLYQLWRNVREEQIHRRFSWLRVAWRLAMERRLGLYDNRPLRDTIHREASGRPFLIPAHAGRVSLVSGLFELVGSDEPNFLDAVWHSATMPIIWEPIGPLAYVDGGLRYVTPLGDALDFGSPGEIVAIVNTPMQIERASRPSNILEVAERALVEITINEIFVTDIRRFVRVNHLVRQAEQHGIELTDLDGEPLRYYPITIVIPEVPLGDTLDFHPDVIAESLRRGEQAARETLRGQDPEAVVARLAKAWRRNP